MLSRSALLLALLLSACLPDGLTRDQAVEAAVRNAPPSAVPIRVESVMDGRLDRFMDTTREDGSRHVWAVALVGEFRPPVEGDVGIVAQYRHHLVILDFTSGEFLAGLGSQ